LFKASDYEFKAEDFHRMCDGKGPTLSLFLIDEIYKDGDCIGGYTAEKWSSPESEKSIPDKNTMIFNLT
jgi:hypothetical protein